MHRSEFPGDEHYKEYLEEVADHCSEGVEEKTNEVVGKIQTLENNVEQLILRDLKIMSGVQYTALIT